MGTINITVKDYVKGAEVQVEVPDKSLVQDLFEKLAYELKIKSLNEPILFNITQNFKYNNDATLTSTGTKPNDWCLLIRKPQSKFLLSISNALSKDTPASKMPKSKIKVISDLIKWLKGGKPPLVKFPEILQSPVALAIILHEHIELIGQCNKQRREIEILREHKWAHYVSAVLFVLAEIVVGCSISLLTNTEKVKEGWVVLGSGAIITLFAVVLSIRPALFGEKLNNNPNE